MIIANNLTLKIAGNTILDKVSFSINRGDYVGLIGPNGAGKTMLIKVILNFYKPTAGTISISDDVKIGYVPQNYKLSQVVPISVQEVLSMSGMNKKNGLLKNLEKVGLAKSFLDKNFHKLSGGQKQRVIIARALCQQPNFLIFDEPFNGLDIGAKNKIYKLLANLNKKHKLTILLVSHEVEQAVAECNYILCLNKTMHSGCHPIDFVQNNHNTCPVSNIKKATVPIHHHHNNKN